MEIYCDGIDSDLNFVIHTEEDEGVGGQEFVELEFDHISDSYVKKYGNYRDERKSRTSSLEEVPLSKRLLILDKETVAVEMQKTDRTQEYNLTCDYDLKSSLSSCSSVGTKRFTLPKRKKKKKLFEEFIVIGIENNGLEYISDIDELCLTPKITYNYPNNLDENELKL
jgi:hypothetical protein